MNIKIRISKKKAYSQTIIVFGLFALTSWFLIAKVLPLPPAFNKTFLLICCSFLIIVFGLVSIVGFKRILNLENGLIVNESGIKINFGPNSGQLIKWKEITGFKIDDPIRGPLSLLIYIKNPEHLISNTIGIKRLLIKMNNRSHGTPVNLTSNWLEYNFLELTDLIIEKHEKYSAQQEL